MEVANINKLFPVELLHMIFSKLSATELKSALLVCRHWGAPGGVGVHPKFWSWVKLHVTQDNLSAMPQVLANRLLDITEIHVREVSEELLQAIDNHPGLKVLNFNQCIILSEESSLAKIVNKMEEVDFEEANLAGHQCQAIFNYADIESKLKRLYMPGHPLSSVEPDILARVVKNLEEVDLSNDGMTSVQCQTIFHLAAIGTNLTILYIAKNDLSTVDPVNLASVVSKLKEVILIDTNLTDQQCEKIFEYASTAAKIKLLYISDNDLSTVDSRHLPVCVSKLVKVGLSFTNLAPEQSEDIFEAVAGASSKLKELDIIGSDLSFIDEELLAKVVSKLNVVDLSLTELIPEQCEELFLHLSRADSKVKELEISHIDLSEISPERLAGGISKLNLLGLGNGNMNSHQCKQIFEKLSSDCKVIDLDMAYNYLDEVNPEDLIRAIPKLKKLNLMNTHLTTRHGEDIFRSIAAGDSKIKKLNIAFNNLSEINPELLAKAIIELNEVDLSYTNLNGEQCKEIFNWLNIDSNLKNLKVLNLFGNDTELVDLEVIDEVSSKLELTMKNVLTF